MYLLEHDAKELLAQHGIPVPQGTLFAKNDAIEEARLPPGPWIVKGQIAAGGPAATGIIRKAASLREIGEIIGEILGMTVKGKRVESVRVEQQVSDADEAYVGFLIDAAAGGVRVIVSERGGVDIEALPFDAIRSETVPPSADAI